MLFIFFVLCILELLIQSITWFRTSVHNVWCERKPQEKMAPRISCNHSFGITDGRLRKRGTNRSLILLLHPSLTDSRNTGAYIAWPRPRYHNIKEKMCMRCSSLFHGTIRPPRFFLFSLLIRSNFPSFTTVQMADMTGETSENVSSFECISFVVLLKHL